MQIAFEIKKKKEKSLRRTSLSGWLTHEKRSRTGWESRKKLASAWEEEDGIVEEVQSVQKVIGQE